MGKRVPPPELRVWVDVFEKAQLEHAVMRYRRESKWSNFTKEADIQHGERLAADMAQQRMLMHYSQVPAGIMEKKLSAWDKPRGRRLDQRRLSMWDKPGGSTTSLRDAQQKQTLDDFLGLAEEDHSVAAE